jgi:pseudouridine synthase
MEKGVPLSGAHDPAGKLSTAFHGNRFRIVLKEGKNRQIRRMVKKVGNRVVRLHRIRVADLKLGRPGQRFMAASYVQSELRRLLKKLQL